MNGMPSSPVISFRRPAVSIAIWRDSITHGPAIRNNGRSSPASKPHSFTRRPCVPSARASATRCLLASAASMNDLNSGWPPRGVEVNSG